MKTLKNIILVTIILSAAASARAEWVRGHFRSNGTYVNSYYRTPANGTPYDNLSYRGYPSQQPGYISPRGNSFSSRQNRTTILPSYRDYQPKTLPHVRNDVLTPPNRRSGFLDY